MKTHVKVERFFTAIALSPLVSLEKKERERRLDERIKRLEEKQKYSQVK